MNLRDSSEIIVHGAKVEQDEAYLRNIMDSMLDIVVQTDLQGNVCYANSACYTMFGMEPERIIGKSIFNYINPQDYENAETSFFSAVKNRKSFRIELRVVISCCRESFWVEAVGSLIKNKDNSKPIGILCIARDIRERKRIEKSEKELKKYMKNEKTRTEFFANLSHELKTPINVIYSALQVMKVHIDNNGSIDKINEYTMVMKQNCHRLIRLISNLVDVTKIESGYFEVNNEYCNIVNVVEEIVQSVVPFVEYYHMKIVFDTDIEEKYTCCDLDIMERIFLNLISNAVKFGKRGQIIEVNFRDKETFFLVSVKDNGDGIPEHKQRTIFNRFVRGTKEVEGSGIGLSLVKSLVELENGTIKLESSEGQGSCFMIEFPVVPGKESEFKKVIHSGTDLIGKLDIEFSDIYAKKE